ncbi:MAG: hypothetical protein V1875_00390 [Candidatus Altiarchaeota archaeon]
MACIKPFASSALALILLMNLSSATSTDCPEGFWFNRNSGVGCQQKDCFKVAHAFYSYVGDCVCYACGEARCSGDLNFKKGCYRGQDYESCPGCLYLCISPEDNCPGEIPDSCGNKVCDKVRLEDCGTCPQDCKCPSTKTQILSCDKANPKADDTGCYILVDCSKNSHVEHEKCECDAGYSWSADNTRCLPKTRVEAEDTTTASVKATSTTDADICDMDGKCEPEDGEDCTCLDCPCRFEGKDNDLINAHMRCEPGNPKADLRGCVFEGIPDAELLRDLERDYAECTNAWVMLNLGDIWGDNIPSQMTLDDVSIVGKWQQRSGCIPTPDGFVIGRRAVKPADCLSEYCHEVIGKPINLIKSRNGWVASSGPGIKWSGGNPITPEENAQRIGLNFINAYGGGNVHGDRPTHVIDRNAPWTVTMYSEYEIRPRSDGTDIYLLSGSLTYYFLQPNKTLGIRTISKGNKLAVDTKGQPKSLTAFDQSKLDPWWLKAEYTVSCPAGTHPAGPDCHCNAGLTLDPYEGRCGQKKADNPDNTNMIRAALAAGLLGSGLLMFAALIIAATLIVVAVHHLKKRRQKRQ